MIHLTILLGWLTSLGPTSATVLGAFIAGAGAFIKAEFDHRAKLDSNLKPTRIPAILILTGVILNIAGAIWAAGNQVHSAEERAQFERDLRLKSEQIAGLSTQIAAKSNDLTTLNQQIAQKSKEIANLNREIANSITGGDEFVYLDPLLAEDQNRLFLIIEHQGKYPIYDVGFRIFDFRISGTKPLAEEMLSNTFTVGNMAAKSRRFVAYWPLVPGKTFYGLNVFFTARNATGFTIQQLRFAKVNGKWLCATEVVPYHSRKHLYSHFDVGFPRSKDGTIDWNDEVYLK